MPDYLRNQIDEGLTQISEKELMELKISDNMFLKDQIISNVTIDIVSDTLENRFSELEEILIAENNINYDYELIEYYVQQQRYSDAIQLFESIETKYEMSPEQQYDYNQMSELLAVQVNLPESNYFEMTAEQKSTLYTLAKEGSTLAGIISRGIIFLVDTVEFPEPEIVEETPQPVTKSVEISEFSFTVSPNPANDYFIAEYDLADTEFKSSEFRMFTTDSKQVYHQTLTLSANQILIETTAFEPGIYTCKLYKNNVEIGSQIIIIKAELMSQDIDNEQLEEMLNTNDQLLVFPNPAKDFVVISTNTTQNATIVIYDNTGKEVYTTTMDVSVKEISTSNLASGAYIIQLKQDNVVLETVKLVVQ